MTEKQEIRQTANSFILQTVAPSSNTAQRERKEMNEIKPQRTIELSTDKNMHISRSNLLSVGHTQD
jgi:hypothetical protein